MPPLTLLQLASQQELAAHARQWDRLWAASGSTLPTLRANCINQWLEAFAPNQPFRALVVCQGERWLAALPLVGGRFKGWLPAGLATSNDWGLSFDLLLDETDDVPAVLGTLAQGLGRLPWGFLSLHHALLDEPRWMHFRAACAQQSLAADWRPQLQIARVKIDGDWSAYRATWSKSHRRHLEKYERALAAIGPVSLEWHTAIAANAVPSLLERGLAVERRGWKGKQDATLQHDSRAWNYLQAQTQELAASGHLRLAFLRVGERDAAFEYGWIAKGMYYSFKVAYDAEFAAASPSHVLTARLLEKFHGVTEVRAFDFLCPLSPAVAHWRPETYTVGRVLLAPRGFAGPLVVRAQRSVLPTIEQWFAGSR